MKNEINSENIKQIILEKELILHLESKALRKEFELGFERLEPTYWVQSFLHNILHSSELKKSLFKSTLSIITLVLLKKYAAKS